MVNSKNIFLYPLSLIYGMITGIRNFLFDSGILASREFPIPVVCVGNITVGGTGKTPHTEYITGLLSKDFRVAVLSRGYKRKSRGFKITSSSSLVRDIGDEPIQIFRKFPEVLVAVDRKRVHGVEKIIEEKPETDVIIMDDGFQHRSLTPGFSVLLSDFERLFVRDHMMPFGNLRESKGNMRRADIILITKSPENISAIQRRLIVKEIDKAPYQNLYFTSITYNTPVPVFDIGYGKMTGKDVTEFSNSGIVLVTGIANPQSLKDYLGNTIREIVHLSFPDHYNFKEKDIQQISDAYYELKSPVKYVFTTEKDAVRLREFTNIAEKIKSVLFYVPVGIHFLNDDKDEFDNLIVDYVRKNKRNNRIPESQRNTKS